MDLNDYWQENKRFVLTVVAGAVAFMIGEMMIGSFIQSDLKAQRNRLRSMSAELNASRYQGRDLSAARAENQSLIEAKETLARAVAFQPREEFRADPERGSLGNQYFAAVSRVRDQLLRDANRAGIRIVPDLGVPPLTPTLDEEIERHLDALDLTERVLRIAIAEGVERVDRIQVKLDVKLGNRKDVGLVEKTRVEMRMSGESAPLLRLVAATQSAAGGPPILIDTLEMVPERLKTDEAKLDVTFIAPRLKLPAEQEEN